MAETQEAKTITNTERQLRQEYVKRISFWSLMLIFGFVLMGLGYLMKGGALFWLFLAGFIIFFFSLMYYIKSIEVK
jgi:hypothetical protein